MSFNDTIKAALEKKKQQQGQSAHGTPGSIDTKQSTNNQVTSNKPSKKSAGRGR